MFTSVFRYHKPSQPLKLRYCSAGFRERTVYYYCVLPLMIRLIIYSECFHNWLMIYSLNCQKSSHFFQSPWAKSSMYSFTPTVKHPKSAFTGRNEKEKLESTIIVTTVSFAWINSCQFSSIDWSINHRSSTESFVQLLSMGMLLLLANYHVVFPCCLVFTNNSSWFSSLLPTRKWNAVNLDVMSSHLQHLCVYMVHFHFKSYSQLKTKWIKRQAYY